MNHWGWWSDGFGWQAEDTALVVMLLRIIALYSGLTIFAWRVLP